jgi:Uma2 family endonuclease
MAEPAGRFPVISPEEYLLRESDASMKHEFVDGAVYMMAGTSRQHNTLALDIRGLLRGRLSKPCEPYALEAKVEVKASEKVHYFYPDVLVTYSDLDNDPHIVKQPVLLIEVLSDSTRDYDRAEKFEKCRLPPSLLEYVLVEQNVQRLELFRKRTAWTAEQYAPPDEINLESLEINLLVSQFY